MDEFLTLFATIFARETEGVTAESLICAALAAGVEVFLIWFLILRKRGVSKKRILKLYLLLLYAGIVLIITIFRRDFGSRPDMFYTGFTFGKEWDGNFSKRKLVYDILNILLFVPFGILMCRNIRGNRFRRLWRTVFAGALFSFGIENLQLLTQTGYFEVTDLFDNIMGSLFGAIIAIIPCGKKEGV